MDFYRRALELKEETVADRRYLHRNAESGLELPATKKYIWKKLTEYGITPNNCGHGITALIGSKGPVILLRADIDALPMKEESGEKFCSITDSAHTCGHDMHAAMLLCAARMLKEYEKELNGTIKLMFQPGEEILKGSEDMISAGVLENPSVDCALAFHVAAGRMPLGIYMYNSGSTMMSSADHFRIIIKGKGGHGAYPGLAVNPIDIAVNICSEFNHISAAQTPDADSCVLTVCRFSAGENTNIIPDTAIIEGTLRTDSENCRSHFSKRIEDIALGTAEAFGGSAQIIPLSSAPSLVCDKTFTEHISGYISELPVPYAAAKSDMKANAAEDFAFIAQKVPSAMVYLSAGFEDERGDFSAHNPKVRFNEDVLSIGAAAYAHCAARWLEDGKK